MKHNGHMQYSINVTQKERKLNRYAIVYYFCFHPVLIALQLLGLKVNSDSSLFGIINLCLAMYFVARSYSKKKQDIILFLFALLTVFVIGMLYPGNFEYILSYITNSTLILRAIPAMFIFRISDDANDTIRLSAYSGAFAVTMYMLVRILQPDSLNYMALANNTIVSWCFFVLYYKLSRKKVWLVISAVYAVVLLFFTSRGGIVYIIAYLTYIVLISKSIKVRSKVIATVALVGVAIYVYFNSVAIFELMGTVSGRFGVYNRLLDTYSRNVLFQDNARSNLWKGAIEYISMRPIIGYGVCGDCVLFGGTGWYVHNMLLELLLDFGLLGGSVLIVAFFYMGFYINKHVSDQGKRELFFLFFAVAIMQTMISYSVFLNESVYISISLYLSMRNSKSYCRDVEIKKLEVY